MSPRSARSRRLGRGKYPQCYFIPSCLVDPRDHFHVRGQELRGVPLVIVHRNLLVELRGFEHVKYSGRTGDRSSVRRRWQVGGRGRRVMVIRNDDAIWPWADIRDRKSVVSGK